MTMNGYRMLIGGRLVAGRTEMEVLNPATEEVLAMCPRADSGQLNEAVAAAKAAAPGWAATPIVTRKAVLIAIADAMDAHRDELARILTQEQGKPLASATRETASAAGRFRYYAGFDLPVEVRRDDDAGRVEIHRKPLGVVAAIVPWNFPLGLMSHKVPPALLAGNTVVLKPAATTPLSTLRFAELIADLVPPGVLNIIADANDLGGALTSHPDVRKVSFTGSVATGLKVAASAAGDLKHATLELGGNDAGIVLDDADPAVVAKKLFDAAFGNSGQVCIALKRLYVHESIYDAVCDELAKLAEAAIVGDGLQQGTEFGPLQNRVQFERVKDFLADAAANGNIIAGGKVIEGRGYFIRPTIVRDVSDSARVVSEEQFGPVLPVMRFSDEDDAVRRANDTPWGLGGSVWSASEERAYALADRMDAGTVWINQHADVSNDIPFGGAKQSGLGHSLGPEGLLEFTQLKVVNIARS